MWASSRFIKLPVLPHQCTCFLTPLLLPPCRWFNSTFLISALLSVLLFYGMLRQKRQEASDRLPVYMAPNEKELNRSW